MGQCVVRDALNCANSNVLWDIPVGSPKSIKMSMNAFCPLFSQ